MEEGRSAVSLLTVHVAHFQENRESVREAFFSRANTPETTRREKKKYEEETMKNDVAERERNKKLNAKYYIYYIYINIINNKYRVYETRI